jgi:phosphopentomutase
LGNVSGKRRAIIVVLDGVGIGSAPDAHLYDDEGANTLAHVLERTEVHLPNLSSFGLGNLGIFKGLPPVEKSCACYGSLYESSAGKDTVAGHWEMMGITVKEPFPEFPDGFPIEVMESFKRETGFGYLWNRPASGTEIIKQLGEKHLDTGKLIVYTSADSVFQIAAHNEVIGEKDLYEICRITREILNPLRVLRVIARPFAGPRGSFYRTEGRKDFPLEPERETVADILSGQGIEVVSVGKVGEMFSGRGFSRSIKTVDNRDTTKKLIECLGEQNPGLFFANLNDFDTLYGHRNDVEGFAGALVDFDSALPDIIELITGDDLLFITADHGNDPTYPGTDHTREIVPVLALRKGREGKYLGVRRTFAVIGATILKFFHLPVRFSERAYSEVL